MNLENWVNKMHDLLKFQVKDGPQIGQEVEVNEDKTSIGGKGSSSDLEFSGIPHGVQFAQIRLMSGKWTIAELIPKSILLNGRPLKRKNFIKSGDVISFPSLKKGSSIRYEVSLTPQKAEKEETEKTSSGIKPAYLIGGFVYLILFVIGALYFAMMGGEDDRRKAVLEISEVVAALDTDIASINSDEPIVSPNIALSDTPTSFEELKKFLASSLGPERKSAIKGEFKQYIVKLFAEAWRLEQQERWVEAKEHYETIVTTMADRDLATTNIALARLRDLN
jgi:hypothetical protein